eukprot:COSAG02_NODE_2175_length_9589_cov_6.644573_4_plen_82_part_00
MLCVGRMIDRKQYGTHERRTCERHIVNVVESCQLRANKALILTTLTLPVATKHVYEKRRAHLQLEMERSPEVACLRRKKAC